MTVTINVNGLTLCHRGSNGVTHNTLPDVCKTPDKGIPRPFDNEAYSRDLADGTTTVFADGGNMIGNFGSVFATSVLDEGGTLGGVISGTCMAEAEFITHSFDVFIEGKPACRLTDKMWMNHRNTVNMAGLMQRKLMAEIRLCAAICYCSNTVRAAAAAGTSMLSPGFWHLAVEDTGGIPTPTDIQYRTQEECVARQFSSGYPIYEPHIGSTDMLAEATYDLRKIPFEPILSKSTPARTTYPGGPTAPASPMRAMAQVGRGKALVKGDTFRPDFVILKDPAKEALDSNVKAYVEIKFGKDKLTDNQKDAKKTLDEEEGKGDSRFVVITEEDCCGDEERARQRNMNRVIQQMGKSMEKAMGLFGPPILGPRPLSGF